MNVYTGREVRDEDNKVQYVSWGEISLYSDNCVSNKGVRSEEHQSLYKGLFSF